MLISLKYIGNVVNPVQHSWLIAYGARRPPGRSMSMAAMKVLAPPAVSITTSAPDSPVKRNTSPTACSAPDVDHVMRTHAAGHVQFPAGARNRDHRIGAGEHGESRVQ